MKSQSFAIWLVFLFACPFGIVGAQQAATEDDQKDDEGKIAEGHSYHGHAFNEGPRQKAYLMDNMGDVSFPVTTKSTEAQKFINQGVAQLHGFWFFESERSFRQAAMLDSDCAMAYWGMAMSNLKNYDRAQGFIAKAVEKKSLVTDRERRYIDATNEYFKSEKDKKSRNQKYVKALEEIIFRYPDDIEAKAFLAVQMWYNNGEGLPITSYVAVDALLEQVFQVAPMHPAHHYRIHLWDNRRAENALDSAAKCGPSLPGVAHMWHMPGHIYSKLKRYEDAAWQQEASARIDHAHMQRDCVMPDQIHNFAHNNEWLVRNLNNVGRVDDAIALAKNMVSLPCHPKYNTLKKRGSQKYGRERLFQTLSRFERWQDLIDLCNSQYLPPTENGQEQTNRLRYMGRACFRLGDIEGGNQILDQLNNQMAAVNHRESDLPPSPDLKDVPKQDPGYDKRDVEKAICEMEGLAAAASGNFKLAYEKLKKAGNIDTIFLCQIQCKSGEVEDAIKKAKKHVNSKKKEVQPLAGLVELLWNNGKKGEAKVEFENLIEISSSIDMDSPLFQRVDNIAKSLGYLGDWRKPAKLADDLGDRPDLDQIGPFRWSPPTAPDWQLADANNSPVGLKDYQGKPVVVVFYLGFGCLHCVEQLQALAPAAPDFDKAGIEIVAIGSDDLSGLKMALENYEKQIPFPLLVDSELQTFKKYRAYDDFENQPLHGTFLIDANGQVRWQDISYEPFMDTEFLLNESQRLLSLDANPE